VHKNEENGKILNLVMTWADEGAEMKVLVPVVYKGVNVCPGLKKGLTVFFFEFSLYLLSIS